MSHRFFHLLLLLLGDPKVLLVMAVLDKLGDGFEAGRSIQSAIEDDDDVLHLFGLVYRLYCGR